MDTPKWAEDIFKEVALQHGKYRKRPRLVFKQGRNGSWHGNWNSLYWQITMYAPYKLKKTDQFTWDADKELLLHEIAHWLTPRQHHNKKFYRKLFRLCQKYNLDTNGLAHEFWYKPRGAHKAYEQVYGR